VLKLFAALSSMLERST